VKLHGDEGPDSTTVYAPGTRPLNVELLEPPNAVVIEKLAGRPVPVAVKLNLALPPIALFWITIVPVVALVSV
jgi:hypothetical protein